jgi:hypothetical protein
VGALGISQLSWKYFESKLIRIGHRFSYSEFVARAETDISSTVGAPAS